MTIAEANVVLPGDSRKPFSRIGRRAARRLAADLQPSEDGILQLHIFKEFIQLPVENVLLDEARRFEQ